MTVAIKDFQDGFSFTGGSADVGPYKVSGGRYGVGVSATWGGGTVTLQCLMPDGSTYVTAASAFLADGVAVVDLPAGMYKAAIATATAVQFFLAPIPMRPR